MHPLSDGVRRGFDILNINPNDKLFSNQELLCNLYKNIIQLSREYGYVETICPTPPHKQSKYLDLIETRAFIHDYIKNQNLV